MKKKPKKGRNTQKLPNKGREERNHMRVTITQRFQNINTNNQFLNFSSGNLWIVLVETSKSILSLWKAGQAHNLSYQEVLSSYNTLREPYKTDNWLLQIWPNLKCIGIHMRQTKRMLIPAYSCWKHHQMSIFNPFKPWAIVGWSKKLQETAVVVQLSSQNGLLIYGTTSEVFVHIDEVQEIMGIRN